MTAAAFGVDESERTSLVTRTSRLSEAQASRRISSHSCPSRSMTLRLAVRASWRLVGATG